MDRVTQHTLALEVLEQLRERIPDDHRRQFALEMLFMDCARTEKLEQWSRQLKEGSHEQGTDTDRHAAETN